MVGKTISADRRELVTAFCCFSASGIYISPAFIFPRKRMKPEYINRAPPETLRLLSDAGYINTDLFIQWLDHFKKHTRLSEDSLVFLILDNHRSQVNLKTVIFCRDNNLHLVSVPPDYSSHRTQPLDSFFKSLKTTIQYSMIYR